MDALERIQPRHLSIERRLKFEAIMLRAFAAIAASAVSKEEAPYDEPCDKLNDERDSEPVTSPVTPNALPFHSLAVALAGQGKVD
jgi:hypothetical protein